MTSYKTISSEVNAELIIKKSKFISIILPVKNKEQVITSLKRLKKQHSKANHICYAFILSKNEQKAFDDGEPSNTAGLPILNVIKNNNLTQVLAVVIRYFGGIKLGAGGLIRAYSKAVSNALTSVVIKEYTNFELYAFEVDYENANILNKIKQKNYEVQKIEYNQTIKVYINLLNKNFNKVNKYLSSLLKKDINLTYVKNVYREKKMTHYFEDIKRKEEDYFLIEDYVANKKYTFKSCNNVFSKNSVDYGTKVLIKTVLKNFDHLGKKVLDLGCGYGAVGVVLANNYPDSHFIMSDITKTASRLSKHNLHLNNITNAEVINSNLFEQIKDKFNFIITNPPIKVGKQVLLNAINQSVEKLKKDGQLVLVIKKSHGKDSIKKAMQKVFGNCEILKRDKGYYILASKKM